mgnify:CR=1 FL=1
MIDFCCSVVFPTCTCGWLSVEIGSLIFFGFTRGELLAPRLNPQPGGPEFSVRVYSLSRFVPVLRRQEFAFHPLSFATYHTPIVCHVPRSHATRIWSSGTWEKGLLAELTSVFRISDPFVWIQWATQSFNAVQISAICTTSETPYQPLTPKIEKSKMKKGKIVISKNCKIAKTKVFWICKNVEGFKKRSYDV